jgi:hypothetical protein
LANAVIAYAADDCLLVWTDADAADEAYSRRNIFEVGSHCLALHDAVEPWIPVMQQVLASSKLVGLPLDQLAREVGPQLVQAAQQVAQPLPNLGVIVAGFSPAGVPNTFGLRSEQRFAATGFGPLLVEGLPSSIFSYFASTLQFLPGTEENVRDLLILMGDVYAETVFGSSGFPRDAEIAVLQRGQSLRWTAREDIAAGRAHNVGGSSPYKLCLGRAFKEGLRDDPCDGDQVRRRSGNGLRQPRERTRPTERRYLGEIPAGEP